MSTMRPMSPTGENPKVAADEPLTPADVQHLQRILESSKAQLLAEIDRLEQRARQSDVAGEGFRLAAVSRSEDSINENMWDAISMQRSVADKQLILMEIEQALKRVQSNQYGFCVHDHAAISRATLDLVPWIQHCSDCARGDGLRSPAPPMDLLD